MVTSSLYRPSQLVGIHPVVTEIKQSGLKLRINPAIVKALPLNGLKLHICLRRANIQQVILRA